VNILRPTRIADYVGQPVLISRLRVLIEAARRRGEPLGHQLLHGPPGLGKTTLAHIIANEMAANVHVALGPMLEKPADVQGLFSRLRTGDVLFIDEIHRLTGPAGEVLYPAMEDGTMSVVLDCGAYKRTIGIDLPPFTLIGATTQPGLLEGPLRDRFGLPLALRFYSDIDLVTILAANANRLGLAWEPGALAILASRSRGTPRIANHLLLWSRDYATTTAGANGHGGALTVPVAEEALRLQGIDCLGLNEQDRLYLRIMLETYGGGPVGAEALASTMGLKPDTVSGVIEPFLLQRGLVARTQRGRKITDSGTKHLSFNP
jgi:Holliday junction DNA helicase RuvB